jgi:hypothetical protein
MSGYQTTLNRGVQIMIGIFLDVAIIVSLQGFFEGFSDDWRDVFYPVIALEFGFLFIILGLAAVIGYWVYLLMALLTFFVLMAWCHMRLHSAAVTTLVMFGVKFAWAMLI